MGNHCAAERGVPDAAEGRWEPYGLNEKFRMCRYEPGGFFLPHTDGICMVHPVDDRSLKTLMVYLNSDYDGGATRFYRKQQQKYAEGLPDNEIARYQPAAGACIVFNQSIVHDGEELRRGEKHIMRTEVMYRRRG